MWMTNEELLILQFQNGDEKAFEELIEHLMPIIWSVIKRYSSFAYHIGIDVQKHSHGIFNELEQECVICIFNLCKTYKFDKENLFACTYVCCKSATINYIWQVKNKTSKRYRKNYNSPQIVSLDSPIFEENDSPLSDFISDESGQNDFINIIEKIDNEIISKDMQFLLNSTFKDDIKGKILSMLYGIGEPRKPVSEIAELFNLSSFEVFEEESKALNIIRHNPNCSWFVKKYAPEYYMELLAKAEHSNNPVRSFLIKEMVQEKMKMIFRKIEGR